MATKVTIRSRSEFQKVLSEAIELLRSLSKETPGFPPYENIARQLDAMSQRTSGGRVPSAEERSSIDVGLVAARELDAYPDSKIQDLAQRLYELNAFFADFPPSGL